MTALVYRWEFVMHIQIYYGLSSIFEKQMYSVFRVVLLIFKLIGAIIIDLITIGIKFKHNICFQSSSVHHL